ncbi:MAG: hypothetical protein K2X34_11435 [Hyphomonadaceae bacterium]|nr:hypothetical protein [Hyphomonadaceae bacterium]
MKRFVAALAAVFTLATAGVAAAQDQEDRREWRDPQRDDRGRGDDDRDWGRDRGRDDGDWGDRRRGDRDWDRGDRGRGGGEITVRDLRGRLHTFNRRDREFDTLVRSPFGMRPGLVYVYTDDCRRGECQVYIYERGSRRSLGHLWAPTLNDPRYFGYGRRDHYGDGYRPRW